MATRATRAINMATVLTYKVAVGQVSTTGQYVQFAADDTEVQEGGGDAVDSMIGVAMDTVLVGETGERRCDVLHPAAIYPCKAGGAVTRGAKQKTTAAGKVTDVAAADGAGANTRATYGFAVNSGIDGDLVGICQVFGNRGIA